MFLLSYFQQVSLKIEFLARRLGTRLQFEYSISFHPNFLISNIFCLKSQSWQLLDSIAVQLLTAYSVNVSLVAVAFS